MKIITKDEFTKMSPIDRRYIVEVLWGGQEPLVKRHRKSKATISLALNGKRKKVLDRIAKSVENQTRKLSQAS